MTQQPSYLRYLEAAKQAETADRLRAEGFQVEDQATVGDMEFDLVAKKGATRLAYEFKAGNSPRTTKKNLIRLQQAAALAGFEFRIVVVNPPPRVRVQIDSLADRLLQELIDNFPAELDILSTHTRIDGVSDIEIADIRVKQDETTVSGRGSIDVELQYGSESDRDGDSASGLYDSYPFDFKATLGAGGDLISLDEISVDTSSFYE